jgi:hypothetical protein
VELKKKIARTVIEEVLVDLDEDTDALSQAVVVFDNDPVRDGRQFHLRTTGYAMLAALGAGHEDGVWNFYEVVRNQRPRYVVRHL